MLASSLRASQHTAERTHAFSHPSWEASSPDLEEYTSVGVGEEGEYDVFGEGVVDDDL
jgi:hypothetical protein